MLENGNEETTEFNIVIESAQAIKALNEVNRTASSIPEVIQNIQNAIQQLAERTGLSFNSVEASFRDTTKLATDLQKALQNPFTAPLVLQSPTAREVVGATNPFAGIGLTEAAGYKAVNDARKEGLELQKMQVKSEADVAKELNTEQELIQSNITAEQKWLELVKMRQAEEANRKAILAQEAAKQEAYNTTMRADDQAFYEQRLAENRILGDELQAYNQALLQQGQVAVSEETNVLSKSLTDMATKSLASLETISMGLGTYQEKVIQARLATQAFAEQSGMGYKQAASYLRDLDAAQSEGINNSKIFGSAGKQGWQEVGQAAKQNSGLVVGGIDLIKRAMSFFVGMILFQVVAAFQQLFSIAIKGLKDMENATYNLINAEKRASEAGVAITPKDLENTVKALQQLDPLISKIQATQAVSGIATKLVEPLGLQKKDIDSLSQSIAVLAVRNQAAGKSFEEVANEVENSLLSGRVSKGINDLGIKLNDQIVKENAIKMGLVENAKAYDDLDGKQKAYITSLSIINELEKNTAEERKNLPSYLNTVSAAQEMLSAKWQDFLALVAKLYGPEIIEGLKAMVAGLTWLMKLLEDMQPKLEAATKLWVGLYRAFAVFLAVKTDLKVSERIKLIFEALRSGVVDTTKYFQNFGDAVDTATAQIADSTTQNLEKAMEEFDKFKAKLDDIKQSYQQKEEDLNIQFNPATGTGRKVEDLNTEYDNKEADAYQDLQDKIADINRDTIKKEQSLKEKARLDDLKAEKDHQEKLRQLRERYLMDLEDALHNRDARAVLRLQAQYQLDVAQENRKYNLDAEMRKKALEQERKDLEKERERQIQDAQIEYQRKLRDLEIAKAREYQTIVKWRQREEDDLRRDITRRLQALIEEYAASEGITAQYLANMLAMVQQYAQQLGMVFQVPFLGVGGGGTAPIGTASGGTASGSTTSLGTFPGGLAEGGSFLAQTPRSINVAENGPELITATPLTKLGSNINKLFLDAGISSKSGQQKIYVQVDLSPDLESRVVQKSMDATANVIQRVNRSQV